MMLKAGAHTAASLWQRDQLLPLAVIATLALPTFAKPTPYLAQWRHATSQKEHLSPQRTCRGIFDCFGTLIPGPFACSR
ncbi:hypothetical protein [Xanthomonas fragariae]|uniref:hypothetical protein n=1 Tax=Xanthomonas fragariae TaxID=48664 RepID=UPI001EDE667F|nr:hypothetical protein [Xanthomonas fragariae]